MSCGSRKDRTDDTVLDLSGQDCLSQLVTTIAMLVSDTYIAIVIIEVEFWHFYIVIAHIHVCVGVEVNGVL